MLNPKNTPNPIKKITVAFIACILCLAVFPADMARAGEGLVSDLDLMNAVASIDGIRVVPAPDIPQRIYTEDYGSSQVWEIIRPDMGPISVGRLATSCSCLRAEMTTKTFARGERALIELRNVKPSQANGAEYGLFVLLASPYRVALQGEVFVKSDRKPGDPGGIPFGSVPLNAGGTGQPQKATTPAARPGLIHDPIAPHSSPAGR